jgi:Phosphoenolpyruvate carboxylase
VPNYVISKTNGVSGATIFVAIGVTEHHLLCATTTFQETEVLGQNLEILAAACLEATLLQPDQPAPREEYFTAMEELSNHAYRAYRNLVYETAGFHRYFWESTVIGEIANLNIGSRPASRNNSTRLEDCALSLGSSAGRNADSCCRAGMGSERRSRPGLPRDRGTA